MRLGGKTKIVGSDKVKEVREWNISLIIYVNDQVRKDDDSGGSRKKSNKLGQQTSWEQSAPLCGIIFSIRTHLLGQRLLLGA